ncbi:hypothetical protein ONZ45_g19102 [Pleurotus djamor]|nr:hypothetical protein ONZ45_g19102 [Pleurotus djamor]
MTSSSSPPWSPHFFKGIESFKRKDYLAALEHFNAAICLAETTKNVTGCGPPLFSLYDSRAAAHLLMSNITPALLDAKRVIELVPDRWQGYARSAKALVQARKYQGARLMLGKARERANVGDNNFAKRMSEFDDLEKEIMLSEQLAFRHLQTNGGTFVASSSGPPASPFSKIPWELTVAIFKEVTAVPHGAPHDVIPSGPSGSSALIQLTAVCRHWRAIAHTVPSLWNRLVLTKLHPEKKAQLWIGRARGQIRQLVIKSSFFQTLDTLRYTHSAQSPEDYLTKTVLKGVLWDGVRSFTTENWSSPESLCEHSLLSQMLPNLETLELLRNPLPSGNLPPWNEVLHTLGEPHPDSATSSRILHLTLDGGETSFSHLTTLGVTNLRTLRLRKVKLLPEGDLLSFLRTSPSLEVLELDGHSHSTVPLLPSPLVHSNLSSLRLIGTFNLKNIFDFLTLPNLRVLDLSSNSIDLTPTFQSLSRQLQCSDDTPGLVVGVQELRITSCSFNPSALVELLRCIPSLRALAVCHYSSDVNMILESLIGSGVSSARGTTVCPNLRDLDVSRSPLLTTGPIVRLVKARLGDAEPPTPARIERLQMDGCPRIEHTALPWLRANVKSISCIYADKKTAAYRR